MQHRLLIFTRVLKCLSCCHLTILDVMDFLFGRLCLKKSSTFCSFMVSLGPLLVTNDFDNRSELGLEAGCDTSSRYHVGQVVKCRVTSSVPASHRINLSFIISPAKVSEDDMVKLGSVVSGVVELVTPNAVHLHVNVKGNMKGTIFSEHLADHQGLAAQLKSALKPGHELSQLLVLDIEGNNLILSAKYSLVHAAQQLPADAKQIHPNSVIHGYVCNLIETGCFVRFLGRLTGFSPRKRALDDRNTDLSEAFYG